MQYSEIIKEQKQWLNPEFEWWPDFFYHFTDVHNAVRILQSGWILSRENAVHQGVMVTENASRAVISATSAENKRYGRLYFRPLTPTQYHNEGYKPEAIRDKNINACCPVPVFLCLDSVATLEYSGVEFAEKGISGNWHNVQSGAGGFSNLNFRKIYHNGPYGEDERDIKDYRHSEIVRAEGFPVEPLLRCILCRTLAEKETLLYLIKRYSMRMYNSYKERILYRPKLRCFNYNGIFIKYVSILNGIIKFEFNDPMQRLKSTGQDIYFQILIELEYIRRDGSIAFTEEGACYLNYSFIQSATMVLRKDIDYDFLRVKVSFDGEVMYENELDIRESEIF